MAGFFSMIGAALILVRGFSPYPSMFSLPLVILSYFAMGILGGLLLGVFRPFVQRRSGATILGIIIGVMVYFIAGLVAVGREVLSPAGFGVALVLGTVAGGYLGHSTWNKRASRR
jgi:hypothetical protein